jgi:hypothetical protein
MTTEKPTLLEIYSVLSDAPTMLRALSAMKADIAARDATIAELRQRVDRTEKVIRAWMPTLLAWANAVPVMSPSETYLARVLIVSVAATPRMNP